MSVARAREIVARLRAARVAVVESDGCYARGNGQTSDYAGGIVHHTGSPFAPTLRALWDGRPDLSGPLCNTAGPPDGSVILVAAHPANHAGASGGRAMGPLPVTTLFNKRVWGHEIIYPGDTPMRPEQYRTATILGRIVADVCGGGNIETVRAHAETSITGKWDPGYAPSRTIDMGAFRAHARAALREDDMTPDESKALYRIREILEVLNVGATRRGRKLDEWAWGLADRVESIHGNGFRALPNSPYGGDLTWFQQQLDASALKRTVDGLTDDEANILAALRSHGTADVDEATLAAALAPLLTPANVARLSDEDVKRVADEHDRRVRERANREV